MICTMKYCAGSRFVSHGRSKAQRQRPYQVCRSGKTVDFSSGSTLDHYPHGLKAISPEEYSMAATIDGIDNFRVRPMDSPSQYMAPYSAFYTIKGTNKRWDMISSKPSVGIVLYHTDLDSFIVVRQFRPAVYAAKPDSLPSFEAGFTYEVCAGLIDKDKPMLQICREEILEECGYDVDTDSITPITTYVGSAGKSGAVSHLFAAKINESMRIAGGGGLLEDGESIEVLALPREKSEEFVTDPGIPKSAGLVAGTMWALLNLSRGTW